MVKMILKITWVKPQLGCYTKKKELELLIYKEMNNFIQTKNKHHV